MQGHNDGNSNGNRSRMTCLMWAAAAAVTFAIIYYFIHLSTLPH
jgi:hypothetical protein